MKTIITLILLGCISCTQQELATTKATQMTEAHMEAWKMCDLVDDDKTTLQKSRGIMPNVEVTIFGIVNDVQDNLDTTIILNNPDVGGNIKYVFIYGVKRGIAYTINKRDNLLIKGIVNNLCMHERYFSI